MKYYIFEDNFPKFKLRINHIERKCKKYDFPFHYEYLGEEIRPIHSEDETSTKVANYMVVEVEGCVRFDNWEVIAELEATPGDNIIRYLSAASGTELSEYYNTVAIHCDHCNVANSRRRFAYVVKNRETNEYKMVGRSCLKEYTHGLDSETVAYYMQFESDLTEYSRVPEEYSGSKFRDLVLYLRCVLECMNKFKYVPASGYRPTATHADSYYLTLYSSDVSSIPASKYKNEMQEVKFDNSSDEVVAKVDAALEWIRNKDCENNDYLLKLKGRCSSEYVTIKDLFMVASLFVAYDREMNYLKDKKLREEQIAKERNSSDYVGSIGQRIEFVPEFCEFVYSTETTYGWSYLYKFIDDRGNTYIWWSSTGLELDAEIASVKGTVKAHEEYNGIKQTVLTRCKVAYK